MAVNISYVCADFLLMDKFIGSGSGLNVPTLSFSFPGSGMEVVQVRMFPLHPLPTVHWGGMDSKDKGMESGTV